MNRNQATDDFLGMADDLDDVFNGAAAEPMVDLPESRDDLDVATMFASAVPAPSEFSERCGKCGGRGKFVSYTGRVVGECFACRGEGFRSFKTSPAQRERARTTAAARKERVKADAITTFAAEHPEAGKWIVAAESRGFDFARSMREAIEKWGRLTERQLAAVERCVESDRARAEERSKRDEQAPTADVSKIEAAFAIARESGRSRIGIMLGDFKFTPAPAGGRNPGAVYVKTRGGEYLGKVLGGRLFKSRECADDLAERVIAAAADPKSAAEAYGHRTGQCAICSRELTDPASIARGIGPICANRFGW